MRRVSAGSTAGGLGALLEPPQAATASATPTAPVASSADHFFVGFEGIVIDVAVAVAGTAIIVGITVAAVVLRNPAVGDVMNVVTLVTVASGMRCGGDRRHRGDSGGKHDQGSDEQPAGAVNKHFQFLFRDKNSATETSVNSVSRSLGRDVRVNARTSRKTPRDRDPFQSNAQTFSGPLRMAPSDPPAAS